MKRLFLVLTFLFIGLSFNSVNAQSTGKVGGYDSEYTTWYNNVKIYNDSGYLIGKAVFSYDTKYECWNNIKYYNYQNGSGYIRLRVWLNGYKYVDKKVWLSGNKHTYLDDVFKHCSSSKKNLRVNITAW